jgi:hypothetical protein
MKKIVVCGDSFMAADPTAPGKHFSEQLDPYEVINLAYPGVSNIDICCQIEHALSLRPDLIVIGTTSPDRIELPVCNDTADLEMQLDYKHLRSGPDQHFVSWPLGSLIEGDDISKWHSKLPHPETPIILKNYFNHCYSTVVKQTIDRWCLEYWYQQIHNNNIKYQILPKTFCVYEKGMIQGKQIPWTFHTDFESQTQAAKDLTESIKNLFGENQ